MRKSFWENDVLWNALGSLVYALASMVLAFAVLRLSGPRDGGIFGFGFSTLGQQLFILAYFGIRPFHITDTRQEYSFGAYLLARRKSSILAILGAAGFILGMQLLGRYDFIKSECLFCLCLYKILDAYADVYESELQRQGLLYRSGHSLCFRTLLSASVLLSALALSHNLPLASLAAVFAQGLGTWLFAIRVLRRECPSCLPDAANAPMEKLPENTLETQGKEQTQMPHSMNPSQIEIQGVESQGNGETPSESPREMPNGKEGADSWRLLRNTSVLCASVYLDFYVFSAAKYAVDALMGSESSGIFNILFMPTSFIYLIANFLIRPTLPLLAKALDSGRREDFHRMARRLLLSVFVLFAVILAGTWLLGRFGLFVFEKLLGQRYAGQLASQFPIFCILVAGGGFYALANVQYYLLISLRRSKTIFLIYLAAALLSFCTAEPLAGRFGLYGASLHYLAMMLLLFLAFSIGSRLPSRHAYHK